MDLTNKTDKEKAEEIKNYIENLDVYNKLKECINEPLYLSIHFVKEDNEYEVRFMNNNIDSKNFDIFCYLHFSNEITPFIGCLYENKNTKRTISFTTDVYENQFEIYCYKLINTLYNYSIDNKDYVMFD